MRWWEWAIVATVVPGGFFLAGRALYREYRRQREAEAADYMPRWRAFMNEPVIIDGIERLPQLRPCVDDNVVQFKAKAS